MVLLLSLSRFISGNDVLLVGNKKDILPKSVKDGKVTQWLTERAHEEGLRPLDVMLTSAQNKYAIKDLIERINELRNGRDVYVVGVTNVGKSTLINAIIQEITGDKDVITTSRFLERPLIKLKSHWMTVASYLIRKVLFIVIKWLIIYPLKS